jgi:FHA domain
MRLDSGGTSRMAVLVPDRDRGRRIPLNGDYMVVGRELDCDVRLDDPHVSRRHAAFERRGDAVYVQDLDSSGGTFVNGVAADIPREVRLGDVLTFASVTARLEPSGAVGDDSGTIAGPLVAAASARYRIGQQHGEVINNVGRDQYNSHIQQVIQQRENFLREIAATKTKARWLVWTGFLAFVVGFGLFAAADLNFIKEVSNAVQSGNPPQSTSPFGREVGGLPIGLAGWALAALGMMLLIVGIVLHIVATSRRRRVDRALPAPTPWYGAGPVRRMT